MTLQAHSERGLASTLPLPDFSLVLGGPLFQLYRRAHLSGDALELLGRRVLVFALFTWLPLLLLSVLDGHAVGGALRIPFLHDTEVQVRFLIALPVLIASEVVVLRRISPLVRRFVERGIVVTEDLPRFNAAVNSALRVRNSVAVELALLVLVYTLGLWIWRSQVALGAATWYAIPDATRLHLTSAGYWYAFVSIPFAQFILLRWYVRLLLWFWLLWKFSKLNLHLTAAHPDHAGGIGFLGESSYAFSPILFAQGALLAGLIASRVLYEGRSLLSFKMEAAGLVGFFVLFILGPLVMFTPQLDRAKREGAAEYGLLANRYVFGFEDKWIRGGVPEKTELLGTGDLQSLADLGNSYSVVREMRIVPFGLDDITRLAAATAVPLLPLMLTIFSLEELLSRLIKAIF
ncbi:MAG TPA: hypothetical protein VK638_26980 [Edaphobacter sp.]|nr:hypothetical protein [Edaphobacter sp.]